MILYRNKFLYFITPFIVFLIPIFISPTFLGFNSQASKNVMVLFAMVGFLILIVRTVLALIYRRRSFAREDYVFAYTKFKKLWPTMFIIIFLLICSLYLFPENSNTTTNPYQAAAFILNPILFLCAFIYGAIFLWHEEKMMLIKIMYSGSAAQTIQAKPTVQEVSSAVGQMKFKYWRNSFIFSTILWLLVTSYFLFGFIRCASSECDAGGFGFAIILLYIPLTISYVIVFLRYLYLKRRS